MYLVARRELASYFNSIWGYVVAALVLIFDGLMFNAFALGAGPRESTRVLEEFFRFSFGATMTAAVFLTMGLVAKERETGTMILLDASPLSDWQIVGGKWLSSVVIVSLLTLVTLYMPALIFVHGKVSIAHIAAGYLGLLLVGAATCAIGTFASTITDRQLVAVVVAGFISLTLVLAWLLAKITPAPFNSIVAYLAIFDEHFGTTFRRGRVATEDFVYYASIIFVFLAMSVRWLSARRWS